MRCLIERRKQIFRGAAILAACLALVLIAKGRVRQGAREPQETSLRDEIPMVSLRDEFKAKIEDLQTAGLWKPNRSLKPCRNTRGSDACYDTACHQRPSVGLEERLQNVRRSAVTVDTAVRNDIMKILNVQPSGKRVLIITGASSDHFLESQGLIQSLHQNVFPELNNYTFVYYDLGLKAKQIQQLKKHCQCEVRRFPVEKMPPMHQKLRCYTWKAFIIESTIGPLLKEANAKGIMMEAGLYPFSVSDHVQKIMFDYFAEQTCYFAQVGEMQATFLVFKNKRFIREAILKPWLACALDSRCMCPSDPEKLLMCNINVRKYNKCHRFDQAALNIILAKLFWGYEQSFTPSRKYIDVNRDGKVHYFDHL